MTLNELFNTDKLLVFLEGGDPRVEMLCDPDGPHVGCPRNVIQLQVVTVEEHVYVFEVRDEDL